LSDQTLQDKMFLRKPGNFYCYYTESWRWW